MRQPFTNAFTAYFLLSIGFYPSALFQDVHNVSLINPNTCFTREKDTGITYTDTLKFLNREGPRNMDPSRYATLYIIRPSAVIGDSRWFGVMTGDEMIVKTDNNSRYKIKVHKEGLAKLWAEGDNGKSKVELNFQFNHCYYLLLELTPGRHIGNVTLKLLDSADGVQLYENFATTENVVTSPFMVNIGSVLAKFPAPHFVSDSSSYLHFGLMKFLPPLSLQYYYQEGDVKMFGYRDIFTSSTFSKFVTIVQHDIDHFDTEEQILEYIKKQIKDGKGLAAKKEKLISFSYEPFSGNNYSAWMVHYQIEDHNALNKGAAKFLMMNDTDVWLFKKTSDKEDVLIKIFFSERGLPEEIHKPEEIRFEALHFINNVKFSD